MTMFFVFAAGRMMERMQSSSKGETLLLQPMIGTKGISLLLQITRGETYWMDWWRDRTLSVTTSGERWRSTTTSTSGDRCESIESKIFKIINNLSRGTLFGDVVARIIYRTRAINQVTPNNIWYINIPAKWSRRATKVSTNQEQKESNIE